MSLTGRDIRETVIHTLGTCAGCGEGGCWGGKHCPCEGCDCPSEESPDA